MLHDVCLNTLLCNSYNSVIAGSSLTNITTWAYNRPGKLIVAGSSGSLRQMVVVSPAIMWHVPISELGNYHFFTVVNFNCYLRCWKTKNIKCVRIMTWYQLQEAVADVTLTRKGVSEHSLCASNQVSFSWLIQTVYGLLIVVCKNLCRIPYWRPYKRLHYPPHKYWCISFAYGSLSLGVCWCCSRCRRWRSHICQSEASCNHNFFSGSDSQSSTSKH